jgi:hypothetical protein
MFIRVKPSGPSRYLPLVENRRAGRHTIPRVLAPLGRVDQLAATGAVEVLLRSLGRFADQVRVIEAQRQGHVAAGAAWQLGPDLVFGRRWATVGLPTGLTDLRQERRLEFPVQGAVSLPVLHRLFEAGAHRAAARWRRAGRLPATERLELHPRSRARRGLGESTATMAEARFHQRRDRFTDLTLAFFDTTSLDFAGRTGMPRTTAPICGR